MLSQQQKNVVHYRRANKRREKERDRDILCWREYVYSLSKKRNVLGDMNELLKRWKGNEYAQHSVRRQQPFLYKTYYRVIAYKIVVLFKRRSTSHFVHLLSVLYLFPYRTV